MRNFSVGRKTVNSQSIKDFLNVAQKIQLIIMHEQFVLGIWRLLPFFVCLFVCLDLHKQFFSYLTPVTNACDRTANLDLCLAHTTFNSEGCFTCHTYCDMGPHFFRVISERPLILPSKCRALGEGAITTYFKRLRFDAAGPNGARTHNLPFAKREHDH
jgi:hypothetical protein